MSEDGRYVNNATTPHARTRVNEDIIMIHGTAPLQEQPSLRGLLLALAALLTLSGVIGLFAALSYKDTKRIVPRNERITLDHVFNGTFSASRSQLSWVPEGVSVCVRERDPLSTHPPPPNSQSGLPL